MSTLSALTDAIRGNASLDDAEDVLAILLLTDPQHLGAEGQALLERFRARSGIDASLDAAGLEHAVAGYLAQHPIHQDVVARLKAVARGLVEKRGPTSSDVQRALSMLGASTSSAPLGGGVRPKGTIAAGPFARAALSDVRSKK